ncbi:MAG TPA: sugar-binding domain-containing protein [Candidatus Dormibacteraeota bacterium]
MNQSPAGLRRKVGGRNPNGRGLGTEDAEVLARIASDYYVAGRNQQEIADELKVSRSYVSRLLDRARTTGIVKITIDHPVRSEPGLESELKDRYGLKHCVVVREPTSRDPASATAVAGRAAAAYLLDTIRPEDTLALSWGTAVQALVKAAQRGRARAEHVVQIFGGLSVTVADISSPDLVRRMAWVLDAGFEFLHAPWIVASPQLAESLRTQPDVAAALRRAAGANIAVVGIGAIREGSSSLLFNETYLKRSELGEFQGAGAVGDICARSFDVQGRPCRLSFNRRVVGLDLTSIRRIPLVIGVATGVRKAAAIRGALEGKLINALITDEAAALAVLRQSEP